MGLLVIVGIEKSDELVRPERLDDRGDRLGGYRGRQGGPVSLQPTPKDSQKKDPGGLAPVS